MTWQPKPRFWTEERVEQARHLYVAEGRSATFVAKAIGAVSRNAVVGKAWRMGWNDCHMPDGLTRKSSSQAKLAKARAGRESAARLKAERQKIKAQKAAGGKKPGPKPRNGVEGAPLLHVGKDGRLPIMSVGMPADAAPVQFWKRPAGRCAWPIGPVDEPCGAESLCCGAPAADDGPYCAAHVQRAGNGKTLEKIRVFEPYVKRASARPLDDRAAA